MGLPESRICLQATGIIFLCRCISECMWGLLQIKCIILPPSTVILNLFHDFLQMRCRNKFGMTNCAKSFRVLFLSWSALTVFTPSSPGESGSILFFASSFSSLIWNAATSSLLWTIFPLLYCLRQFRICWQQD